MKTTNILLTAVVLFLLAMLDVPPAVVEATQLPFTLPTNLSGDAKKCGGLFEEFCPLDFSPNGIPFLRYCDSGPQTPPDPALKVEGGKCVNFHRIYSDATDLLAHEFFGWVVWALGNQRDQLAIDEPLNWVMHLGAHNAASTRVDGYRGELINNQWYSMTDQLRLGVRTFEIDTDCTLFNAPPRVVLRVVHGSGSVFDRPFFFAIKELAEWLTGGGKPGLEGLQEFQNFHAQNDPPIIIGYGDEDSQCDGHHGNPIQQYFGPLVYKPEDYQEVLTLCKRKTIECSFPAKHIKDTPRFPTRREMLENGKQVIYFGLGREHPYYWRDRFNRVSARALGFDYEKCKPNDFFKDLEENDGEVFPREFPTGEFWSAHRYVWPRVRESLVPLEVLFLAVGTLGPTRVRDLARCNVTHIALDQLYVRHHAATGEDMGEDTKRRPGDMVWSWKAHDFGEHGYAMFDPEDGRWTSRPPEERHAFACAVDRPSTTEGGEPDQWKDKVGEIWAITNAQGTWDEGWFWCEEEYGPGKGNLQLLVQMFVPELCTFSDDEIPAVDCLISPTEADLSNLSDAARERFDHIRPALEDGLVFSVPVNGYHNERLRDWIDFGAERTGPLGICQFACGTGGVWLNYRNVGAEGEHKWVVNERPLVARDTTPPDITPTVAGLLGNNNWYRTPVTIDWTVEDPESSIISTEGCDRVDVIQDTAETTFTCVATSTGGSTSESVAIKRDATAPIIVEILRTPSANVHGWNNTAVTVDFVWVDDLSGIDTFQHQKTITAQGADQFVLAAATDKAGNFRTAKADNINIDLTPPDISGVASPRPNAAGWNKTDVTVSFTCHDTLSGIVSCGPNQTLTEDGAHQDVTGVAVDKAGNSLAATVEHINIDKTPPIPQHHDPFQVHEGSTVLLDGTGFSDVLSGVQNHAWAFSTSPAPESLPIFDQPDPATFQGVDGPATVPVWLQVEDVAGNSAVSATQVTVLNVVPVTNAGPDQSVNRNDTVSVSGTWTDPAASLDNPYQWSWDLDGDGNADQTGTASYADTVAQTTSFALEGFYTLTFEVTDKDGGSGKDSLVVEVLNQPPDCTGASPSIASLWPPNRQFTPVNVTGLTDPEGDALTITIDSISQDEPVASSSSRHDPDARGLGTDTAEVRAERLGTGDGRVYHIRFTADDGHGSTCSSEVLVGVPHSQGTKGAPVDGGALYDSTGGATAMR